MLAAVLGLLISTSVLLGYTSGSVALVRVYPGLQGMSPLTAIGIACLSIALLPGLREIAAVVGCSSLISAGLAVCTLISRAITGQDALSLAVARFVFAFPVEQAGQTSAATAACLLMLATAQAASRSGNRPLCNSLIGITLIFTGVALLGYAYGVTDLYAIPIFNTMALHTALTLFILAAANSFRHASALWLQVLGSERSSYVGTRKRLLCIVLLPIGGWVVAQGIHHHILGPFAGIALLVVMLFLPLVALIVREGRAADALELAGRAKEAVQAQLSAALEAQLSEQREELEHQTLSRRSAEAAMHRAQRMEAVGQLTGGIAHDFNNLLMAVSGNLDLLKRKLPAEDKAYAYAERALLACDKGKKLTGQLLAFSRTQKLDVTCVEVQAVIASVRELLVNALGAQIRIEVDLPQAPVWVMTDSNQLELAVLNLALNARDAMPTGGVFRIQCLLPSDAAQPVPLRISDTGVGMAPEVLARAGEPFFTTKERGKGTGLGLAQVYGLCRQCQGDMKIISELGVGTTVEMVLPGGSPMAVLVEEGVPEYSIMATDASVGPLLIVDDDDEVRAVLADSLRQQGYEILEAANGVAALQLLDRIRPIAAIIDFIMPGMNGAEVARLALKLQPAMPIIFVSGYSDTLALDGIPNAVVLRKPINLDLFHCAVAAAVR